METQTECPRLEERTVIKFVLPDKDKRGKFTEECKILVRTQKHVLVKTSFMNEVNIN